MCCRLIHAFTALTVVSAVVALSCCSKQPESKIEANSDRETPSEVIIEIRTDQLAYLPGAAEPFTGDAVSLHADRVPPSVASRIPHLNGKKHGIVATFTAGGKLREERRFENGKPISSVVYHGNGKKKIEVLLNEKNINEGPYKRWHDNGVLQSESGFDSEGRLHGVEKNYDNSGKLIGHYVKKHGQVTEIVFESPEMKAERLERTGHPAASVNH